MVFYAWTVWSQPVSTQTLPRLIPLWTRLRVTGSGFFHTASHEFQRRHMTAWVRLRVWEGSTVLWLVCPRASNEHILMQLHPPSSRWWTGWCRPQGGRPWWRASGTGSGRGSEYSAADQAALTCAFFCCGWLPYTYGHILTARSGRVLISAKPQNDEPWDLKCFFDWHTESSPVKHTVV